MSSLNRRSEAMKTSRDTVPEASPPAASSRPQRPARGRRRYLIGASALAALATALLPSAASASPPQQTVFPINDTITVSDICAFPIVETVHGTARIIEFTDQSGNVV